MSWAHLNGKLLQRKCPPGSCRCKDPAWRFSCSEGVISPLLRQEWGQWAFQGLFHSIYSSWCLCCGTPGETRCFQTGSTTSHLSPNQWDLAQHTGIWCSRHSLVFWVQTTFGNSCYLHKNPSVFTCKPIFHSHMVLPRHKCHSTSARPHFNMLTTHIPHLPEQNPPSSAWTKKIPYPSSILSQLPQEQARIWLTWVHACVHWEF